MVVCAGNHDGLLCADDECLACHSEHLQRCEAGTDAHKGWLTCPSDAARCARDRLLEGLSPDRARVLTDEAWDFLSSHGVPVRVVGSPWTSYDTRGVEHISRSPLAATEWLHLWTHPPSRARGGGQGIQTDLNDEFGGNSGNASGDARGGERRRAVTAADLGDARTATWSTCIVRGTSARARRCVWAIALMETLSAHALSSARLWACPCDAVRRAAGRTAPLRVQESGRMPLLTWPLSAASRHHESQAAAGSGRTAFDASADGSRLGEGPATLLMRPPTVIELPVDGWHVADDQGWQMAWQLSRREQVACE